MSFGFSVGDIITVTRIAWDTYVALRNASEDFQGFASEVHSLHTTLTCLLEEASSPVSILQYVAPQKMAGLKDVIRNCESSLLGLQQKAKQVCLLQPRQKRQFWEEFKLAFKDKQGPRDRIAIHTACINMFLSSLTHNSLGRLELLLTNALRSTSRGSFMSFDTFVSQEKETGNAWNEIGQDLLMEGIGEQQFRKFTGEIKAYVRYLVHGGKPLSETNFRLARPDFQPGKLFGAVANTPQTQSSSGLFGNVGSGNTDTGGFGNSSGTQSQGSPFGGSNANQASSGFGGKPAFGSGSTNTGTGLFGNSQSQATTGGLFGNNNNQQQQNQSQQGSSLFGENSTTNSASRMSHNESEDEGEGDDRFSPSTAKYREGDDVDIDNLVSSFDELFPINEDALAAESIFVPLHVSGVEGPRTPRLNEGSGRGGPITSSGTSAKRPSNSYAPIGVEINPEIRQKKTVEKREKVIAETRQKLVRYERGKEEAERNGDGVKAADFGYNFIPAIRKRLEDLNASHHITCDACLRPIVERHAHCGVCWGGDYDLCQACVESGVKCEGNHPLEVREWTP